MFVPYSIINPLNLPTMKQHKPLIFENAEGPESSIELENTRWNGEGCGEQEF